MKLREIEELKAAQTQSQSVTVEEGLEGIKRERDDEFKELEAIAQTKVQARVDF